MHNLLRRQLRLAVGMEEDGEVDALLARASVEPSGPEAARVLATLPKLLRRIGASYTYLTRELDLCERSLQLSSSELLATTDRLRSESQALERAVSSLRSSANRMLLDAGRPELPAGQAGLEDLCGLVVGLIMERQEIQSELAQQKQALDHHAIVSITDAEGTILYANEKFCRISQYSQEELIGKNHRIVTSGYHPPSLFKELWDRVLAGEIWHGDLCNRKKDGSLYWVSATVVPILGPDGQPRHFIAIRTDITAIKRMEEELKTALSRAEAGSRAKGEFLATMSHEIRTPMNGILGMTSLLLDTRLDGEQRHFADTIRVSAESLLGIINDILDFSRLEAGKVDLETLPFEIAALVDGVADILAPRLQGKAVALSCQVPPEAGGVFHADPGRLRQVLLNLAGNAVKFTERGTVSIAVSVAPLPDGRTRAEFRVADTGVGIPAEAQGRLFHAFTQADASTVRRYGGSGLGLAICRRLVEAMDGEIGFASEEGKGSVFHFWVPLLPGSRDGHPGVPAAAPPPAPPSPAEAPEAPWTGPALRILVVDDNAINRQVAVGLLAKLGHRAEEADSGQQAVERHAAACYDLVLMDVHMPRMDGYDATGRIRALGGQAASALVVAMTANAMVGDRERCLAAGMDDYVSKPLDRKSIAALLGRWHDRFSGRAATPETPEPPEPPTAPPPPSGDEPPLVSAAQQDELLDSLGRESCAALYAAFRGALGSKAAGLGAAVAAGDAARVASLAHAMKGEAANLGFPRLARRAQDLELAAKASRGDLAALCRALEAAASATTATIDRSDA